MPIDESLLCQIRTALQDVTGVFGAGAFGAQHLLPPNVEQQAGWRRRMAAHLEVLVQRGELEAANWSQFRRRVVSE